MGIGPTFAIPKILEKTGLRQEDVDIFEINEAFASMVSVLYLIFYFIRSLTEKYRLFTAWRN
jgi:hypothetical protein